MPFLAPAGGLEGPVEEGLRVVEAEHGLAVLDVVAVQELVDLFQLFLVAEVHRYPFEAFGHSRRFFGHGFRVDDLDGAFFDLLRCFVEARDGLCLPELV